MIRKLALLLTSSLSTTATCAELRLLEPKDVYIDAYQNDTVHDPYLYPLDQRLGYGGAFNVDTNVIRYGKFSLYWLNKLHFDQDRVTGHIKHAGWQYELGIPLWMDKGTPRIELFRQHHSRHLLEETRSVHFPVYDRTGIRLRIYP